MFALDVRFSRKSMTGALLLVSTAPAMVNASSCDSLPCLTTSLANAVIDNGSSFHVGTGGDLQNARVSQGAIQLWDQGQANGTTVVDNGWLQAQDDASINNTRVENGNLVVVGAATALNTHVQAGSFDVAQSGAASNTWLEGGDMWVYTDALAKRTRVDAARMTVYQNGRAQQTTVNNGGELMVGDTASVDDTLINQGGTMASVAGTTVSNTTVNEGGLMVLGADAAARETRVNTGGALQLKGDAALDGASHLDGRVEFADPVISGGFHTLNINGPLSGNGTFWMNTDLAALRGDLLKVQGPISDTHTLIVADSGNVPSGTQQPLMLVDGKGGSGDFKLYGGTVDAGAFRYTLHQQGDDWYLDKPAVTPPEPPTEPVTPPVDVNPEPPLPPTEENPPPVQPPVVIQPPFVQPPQPQAQTLSKGANAAVAAQAAAMALLDVQGYNTRQHFSDLRTGHDKGGVWVRAYGAEQQLETTSSRAFEQQVKGMELGADKAFALVDGTLYAGALIGQGRGDQDFGERSKGSIDSTTVGAYASYQDRNGFYMNGALKYSRLDNEIKITSNLGDPVKAHYKSNALSAQAQMGKTIDLGQSWYVEPQAALQAARISGERYKASNGLDVKQNTMTSVQSRIGAEFGREVQLDKGIRIKPFANAAWVTEHAGDSDVSVNGATLDSRLPGSRAELGVGLELAAARSHHLYVQGQYVKGSEIEQPWAVNVGYRYNW